MSKRMFSTRIVESDAFLDMPLTAQSLYFHLVMYADNDGFVSPKKIMRMLGAGHDDLQILIAKKFLIAFDSGVVVIKHWWINNTKRGDRYVKTTYMLESSMLIQKDNNSYSRITNQLQLETAVEQTFDTSLANIRQISGNQDLPQYNTKQSNSKQFKPIQVMPKHEKKVFEKSKSLDKKAYAIAVQRDKELMMKEQQAINRSNPKGYETFSTIGEQLKKRKK